MPNSVAVNSLLIHDIRNDLQLLTFSAATPQFATHMQRLNLKLDLLSRLNKPSPEVISFSRFIPTLLSRFTEVKVEVDIDCKHNSDLTLPGTLIPAIVFIYTKTTQQLDYSPSISLDVTPSGISLTWQVTSPLDTSLLDQLMSLLNLGQITQNSDTLTLHVVRSQSL